MGHNKEVNSARVSNQTVELLGGTRKTNSGTDQSLNGRINKARFGKARNRWPPDLQGE